jgi:alpha(1,3/1,4) fucosyltransferase
MTLKIHFCDFWPGFEKNNLFLKFLEKHYLVSISNDPDYLFYSVYGNSHLKFKNCVKILFTGENLVPDFNLCDYAMGYHYLSFEDRYMRLPLYVYYQWHYAELKNSDLSLIKVSKFTDNDLVNRKFCNFVYSNNVNSNPIRDSFFHELSKYKRVDSGGRHLNNMGKPVPDKLNFIKDYKFSIAFENSSVPGYTTEKLLEPIITKSLPIYFGNPMVHLDFNTDSFVCVKDHTDFDRAIEEIIRLDKDDKSYLEKLKQDKFDISNTLETWEETLLLYFNNIFKQPLSSALRKPDHGFNKYYTEELILQGTLLEKTRSRNSLKSRIKSIGKKAISFLNN